jgi:glycosyltransferase involved in cell wall biosynthesis
MIPAIPHIGAPYSAAIDPMPARRLLIVSYPFPPMPSVGAHRWDAMARHLRRLGNEVTIVTTSAFGPMRNADEERHVARVADLTSARSVRRLFGRGPLPAASDAPAALIAGQPLESPLPESLRKIFVPDLYVATWVPQATVVARRVVRERRIECVITTSPYESTHLMGPALRRAGAAWVADFRDGWSFEPHRPGFPTGLQRRLDRWMERHVAGRADRVVAATSPIADDFRGALGIEAVHIANGFDPLRYADLPPPQIPALDEDAVVLAHTGTLAGINNRDPSGLFAAMRRLRDEDPQQARRLRLLLAGRLDTEDIRLVQHSGLSDEVIRVGELSHAESIALQRSADALVLITSAGGSELTGKLFEYLSAGRPIIALAGSAVAEVVRSTGTGVAVRADDVDAITTQLRRLLAGELASDYRPENLEPYVYPGPAKRMAALIDEAVAARSGGEH